MATLQEAERYSCVVLMGQGVPLVRATGMAHTARLAERTKAWWDGDAHGHGTVYCTVSDQQQRELRSCILVRHSHQDSMTAAEKTTETTIVCWNRTEHSDMREQERWQTNPKSLQTTDSYRGGDRSSSWDWLKATAYSWSYNTAATAYIVPRLISRQDTWDCNTEHREKQ